jgi:transketolase
MRQAFVKAMCELAEHNRKIMLITGDLGYKILEPYAQKYPDQFCNIGVAEANLVTVAAGLSTVGFVPYIYSIAVFATMRAFEQIRDDIILPNSNVKIVGIGAGLAYTLAGATHHSVEDIAIMRSLPGMKIISPADPFETFVATKAAASISGPVYLRLEKNPQLNVYDQIPKKWEIGKAKIVEEGKKLAIFFTGTKYTLAKNISEMLHKNNIHPTIISVPTVAPLDHKLLAKVSQTHPLWMTLEEHHRSGGFGTAVSEYLEDQNLTGKIQLLKIGLNNEIIQKTGNYEELLSFYGMSFVTISKKIHNFIG